MTSSDLDLSSQVIPFPKKISVEPLESPAEVKELAQACVQYVERKLKFKLDYSLETLPVLDHYIALAREDLKGRLGEIELLLAIAAPAGAYLGEVIQKLFPLRWFCPSSEYHRWRVEFEHIFLSMNPIGVMVEALKLAEDESWGSSFRLMPGDELLAASALENTPDVSVEEYFAPSSRLEVLHTIVDVVWHAHINDSKIPKIWGPDEYAITRAEAIRDHL